jgi:hypothetical protein
MQPFAISLELRKHPRSHLQMLARIRSRGPFGMRLEVTQTIDASREGLLVHRREPCDPPSRVWVVFPFDPSSAAVQPETPARVVRVEDDPMGGYRVALHLEQPSREQHEPPVDERRATQRIPFALPIFVRPKGTPWPEESMTRDVSSGGAKFYTLQGYLPEDTVLATIPWGEWSNCGEISGRVVRVETPEIEANAPQMSSVAVQWLPRSESEKMKSGDKSANSNGGHKRHKWIRS